ncbi:MAG: hypothetical protein AB1325_13510 [Nitrospirota bacterium]
MSDLITLKTHRNEKFSTIYLGAIEDPRLSWKAKGIHTYLISRPTGWKVRLADLLRRAGDGKASLLRGIGELKDHGYVVITRTNDEKGRFTGTLWEVYEGSQTVEKSQSCPYSDFPDTEKPESGKPVYGKSDHIIYNSTNIDHTNITTTPTHHPVVVSEGKEKDNGFMEAISEGAIRAAMKAYRPEAHAAYQPETAMEGIRRILSWMCMMPRPKNPAGFLLSMARKGMDKPAAVVRAEQEAEAERREAEERRRRREEEEKIRSDDIGEEVRKFVKQFCRAAV